MDFFVDPPVRLAWWPLATPSALIFSAGPAAPWPWAHPGCMLTWSPSCESLVAIRPFACEKKRFAQKFTDRQTDRRRTPRHCISSFLEWAKNVSKTYVHRTTKTVKLKIQKDIKTKNLCTAHAPFRITRGIGVRQTITYWDFWIPVWQFVAFWRLLADLLTEWISIARPENSPATLSELWIGCGPKFEDPRIPGAVTTVKK